MPTERVVALSAMWRHKKLSALIIALGVILGLGLALVWPTNYTAETRLAVGGTSLAATAVPGFALASQELAANYARYVNNAQEQSDLESTLGVREGTVQEVLASPIPASNVVRVEVVASDAAAATRAAAAVAESLVRQVNASTDAEDEADVTLEQYTDITNQVAAAEQASDAAAEAVKQASVQSGADVAALREQATQRAAELDILTVQQQALGQKYRAQVEATSAHAADLTVVEQAVYTGSNRLPNLERFGLAGAVLGAAIALALSVVLERRGTAPTQATRRPGRAGAVAPAGMAVGTGGVLVPGTPDGTGAVADDRVG
jgi:hypothetical protein